MRADSALSPHAGAPNTAGPNPTHPHCDVSLYSCATDSHTWMTQQYTGGDRSVPNMQDSRPEPSVVAQHTLPCLSLRPEPRMNPK